MSRVATELSNNYKNPAGEQISLSSEDVSEIAGRELKIATRLAKEKAALEEVKGHIVRAKGLLRLKLEHISCHNLKTEINAALAACEITDESHDSHATVLMHLERAHSMLVGHNGTHEHLPHIHAVQHCPAHVS